MALNSSKLTTNSTLLGEPITTESWAFLTGAITGDWKENCINPNTYRLQTKEPSYSDSRLTVLEAEVLKLREELKYLKGDFSRTIDSLVKAFMKEQTE